MHDHHLIWWVMMTNVRQSKYRRWVPTLSLKTLFIPSFLLLVILYNTPTLNIIFIVLHLNSLNCIYHYACHTGNKCLLDVAVIITELPLQVLIDLSLLVGTWWELFTQYDLTDGKVLVIKVMNDVNILILLSYSFNIR